MVDRIDDTLDHKGLIRESFRIEDIDSGQCRSIFLDWALNLPDGTDAETARRRLLSVFEKDHGGHPMIAILREGLNSGQKPRRRGGWRGRDRG